MSRTAALALATLTSLVALAASRPAAACSQVCMPQPLAFAGATLPAGVKALPLPYGGNGPSMPPVLKLAGAVVSTTATTRMLSGEPMLVPDMPLVEGAYTLEYRDPCNAAAQATAAFTVGAAKPAPTSTGTFHVTTRFVAGIPADPNGTAVSSCGPAPGREDDHMVADIVFEPAADLVEFLPITRYDEDITGPDPAANVESPLATGTFEVGKSVPLSLEASCDPAYRGPKQGKYTLSLAGQLLGSDSSLAPASVVVDLTCPAFVLAPGAPGAPGIDTPAPSSNSGGGCTTSPSSSSGGSALGLLAALGVVLAAARSRRGRR